MVYFKHFEINGIKKHHNVIYDSNVYCEILNNFAILHDYTIPQKESKFFHPP